ncbi:protein of unknown function (plasmid) [Cupriavidus neocaledonicus]|uniref:Uncharacterized protein n=1 Tax=Cupriavidus neocaledonicus TaxID=1040979 RepID=A0A375HKL4_9BURK|nr:protein of unknown function [Cupriavidus neocaledonicus]
MTRRTAADLASQSPCQARQRRYAAWVGAMRAMRHARAAALLQRVARFTQRPAGCGGPNPARRRGYGAC